MFIGVSPYRQPKIVPYNQKELNKCSLAVILLIFKKENAMNNRQKKEKQIIVIDQGTGALPDAMGCCLGDFLTLR